MIVINNIDSQRFTFNGVEYYKNFTPIVIGTKIRILNAYDSTIELTDSPRLFSEFEVDGLTYANVSLLQSALLPILYTRDTLGGGGSQNLQEVTDIGNTTTNAIEASAFVSPQLNLIDSTYYTALKADTLTTDRELFAPDENGVIATREWSNTNKQDKLTEVNFGAFMDLDLATKLTPMSGDFLLGRDILTNEAVEIPFSSVQPSLGFTPEDVANKENTTLDTSTTKYPTNRLVKEYVDAKVPFDIIKDYPNQIVISATGGGFTNIGTYAQTVTGTQSDILIGGEGVAFRKILSATTAGSNANFYDAGVYRITGTKGFYYRARIKNDDPTNISTHRFSYGLSGTAIMGNINPSTYSQALLSFGADNSDTNCQIMYKLSGGATTKINLGATMPKSQTNDYVIEFWRLEGTTTINYKVHNLTTSAIVSGSFTFAFSGLALGCFRNNDIATTAVSFAVRRVELYIND